MSVEIAWTRIVGERKAAYEEAPERLLGLEAPSRFGRRTRAPFSPLECVGASLF